MAKIITLYWMDKIRDIEARTIGTNRNRFNFSIGFQDMWENFKRWGEEEERKLNNRVYKEGGVKNVE